MKQFIEKDFLLNNPTAVKLYHDYAEKIPIFDYHCHISPAEIAMNKRYRNITELWLGGDHYKWRAMRSNGIDEKFITGNASDKDKFLKWAETVPYCIGNPLYHWTHLELKRFFGIDCILSPETAEEVWDECNSLLQEEEYRTRGLIKRSNVKIVCTIDDPLDSLEHHMELARDCSFDTKVLPSFRPDKFINIDRDIFRGSVEKLKGITGRKIECFEELKHALIQRMDFFSIVGCKSSDHAIDNISYRDGTDEEASLIYEKRMLNHKLTIDEVNLFKTRMLLFLGREYSGRDWVMQLHMGAVRNTNKRMMKLLGPDTGFDAIGDCGFSESLCALLNSLEETDELPKTILFCLNPKDNEVLGSITGCFQGAAIPGKIQFGSSWWFNDHKDGIVKQLTTLANLGLLSRFLGMLTDSRCFLSYPRHEYFRRILCNLLGEWVENGEVPCDMKLLSKTVEDICYNNTERYFGVYARQFEMAV